MSIYTKHSILGTLCLAGAMLFTPLSAHALMVTAKGRDAATAEKNARVNAVRKAMQGMVSGEFLAKNTLAVRDGIILRAAELSRGITLKSSAKEGSLTVIEADVDIDLEALAQSLTSLGATVSYSPSASPAQKAEADAPEDGDAELNKLAEAYLAEMRLLFGGNFKMRPQSAPIPLPAPPPVTESFEAGAKLAHVPQAVKNGEGFWFRWDNPDGKNSGRIMLCRADAPLGTQEELDKADITYWNLDGSQGIAYMEAPVPPGAYELRLFPDRDGKSACVARAGFAVKSEGKDIPCIRTMRNFFVPEEEISVELFRKGAFPDGKIFIARQSESPSVQRAGLEPVTSSKAFREMDGTHFTINAPREPGRYAFYVFPQDKDHALAIASLPFEVRQPRDPEKALLAVPPYLYSGEKPSFFARSAPEWEWERMDWQVRPRGECADWGKGWLHAQGMDLNKVNLSNPGALGQFFDPGDYTVSLFNADPRKEGAKPVLQAHFRVLPAPLSSAVRPSLRCEPAEAAPDEFIKAAFAGRQEWKDGWLGLVPRAAPKDAPSALEAAGKDNIRSTDRKMSGTRDFYAPLQAGAYEIRLYDGKDEKASLQAVFPVTVLSEAQAKARDDETDRLVEELLNAPEPTPVRMDDGMLRRQFRVPKIRNSEPGSKAHGTPPAAASATVIQGNGLASASEEAPSRHLPVLLASADPAGGGLCQPCGKSRSLSDAARPMLLAAARDPRCDSYIDQEIDTMRKLDVTLGRDNALKDALWDAAVATLTKFPVNGKKAQQLQKVINIAYDSYSHGTAGIDAYESGDYLGAAQNALALVLKGAVNLCDDKDCFEKVRGVSDDMLKKYVSSCSEGEYKALLQKASRELGEKSGMLRKIEGLRTGADYAMNVDAGTAASKGWDSQDYADMLWTLGEGAVTTAWPPSAVVIAAAKATKQGALAARDFIVDDSTQTLYKTYKENMDGGKGQEDFTTALSTRNNWYSLTKARSLMVSNLHKPEVLKSLGKANRILAKEGRLSPDDLSQEEIWGFLRRQFDAWIKAEKSNSDYAQYANSLREDYRNMECAHYFDNVRKPEKKGVSDRMSSWWNNYCPDEVARFRDYVKARADIENELKRWAIGGKNERCVSPQNLREDSRDLLCALVTWGEEAYLDRVVDMARQCGWKLGDDKLGERARELKVLERQNAVVKAMTKIGRRDVLNCLCCAAGVTGYGVMCAYDPAPHPNASPSCGKTSPPCIGGNWGCFRYGMATGKEALERCGAYEAYRQWKRTNGPVDK